MAEVSCELARDGWRVALRVFSRWYSQGAGRVLPKTGYTADAMGKTNFFDFKESTTRRAGGGAGNGATRGPNGASAPAVKDAVASKPSHSANGPRGTEPLSVSQLTRLIDDILKSVLPPVLLVKGEVSNFKPHGPSGHLYFTL
jgi:hypothetical protein